MARPRLSAAVGFGSSFDAVGFDDGNTRAIPAFFSELGIGDGPFGFDLLAFASQAAGRHENQNPVDRLAVDLFGVIRPGAWFRPDDRSYGIRVLHGLGAELGLGFERDGRSAVSGTRFLIHTGARADLPLTPAREPTELRLRLAVRRGIGLVHAPALRRQAAGRDRSGRQRRRAVRGARRGVLTVARPAPLLGLGVLSAVACGATVEVRPGMEAFAPTIVTVVEMPPAIDWTGPGAQQRVQRIAADSLLEVTGGRAVIADELPGTSEWDVQSALRALGEDPANAVTFSISIGLGRRLVPGANPIAGFQAARRVVVDYVARVEVRHVGAPDVIGTVEAIESGLANEPETTGSDGEKRGAAAAIDAVLDEAVRTFAPRIHTPRRPTLIVEVPVAAANNLIAKLEALQRLYPELSMDAMQALAAEPRALPGRRARPHREAGCRAR